MGKGILSVIKRFLFILAAVESFSQVIIREKVEIEPYDIVPAASVSRDHSVTFEMSWSNPEACCNIRITAACGEILNSGWTCGGFTSITINPIKGSRLEWLFEYEGDFPLNHTKKIIFDDQPPAVLPFNTWGASMVFNSLYQLKFDLEGVCVGIPKIIHTGTADCNSRIWVHSDSITFTITEGNDYVSFYNSETWELYGNSVSCLSDDLWQIAIIQDKKHADSGDIPVKVFSEVNGFSDEGSVIIYSNNYRINAEVYPDHYVYLNEPRIIYLSSSSYCGLRFDYYKAEIIKGRLYGDIEDPYSGTKGKVINNLIHSEGSSYIIFHPLNEFSPEGDTVVIEFTSSVSGAEPAYMNLYINPSPLAVSINPPALAPGDTAEIIIQKRNRDGTIENFPPGQSFELAIKEGCGSGVFLSAAGDTASYFENIRMPVKFIASDDLDINNEKVKITAGTESSTVLFSFMKEDSAGTSGKGILKIPDNNSDFKKIINDNKGTLLFTDIVQPKKEKLQIEKYSYSQPDRNQAGGCPPFQYLYSLNGEGEVIINKKEIDHFEVKIIPDTLAEEDTLAFGEAAKMVIQAKDSSGNDVQYDNDKLLTFSIESNPDYGTFIDERGNGVEGVPVILKDITYKSAGEGKIKFAAYKENPDSVIKCLIKVVSQDDSSKQGKRESVVLEQTLRIEMEESKEVTPIITNLQFDTESLAYKDEIGPENRKKFSVIHTRGGKRVESHRIKLSSDYVDESGGHNHTERRPDSAFSYQRSVNGLTITSNIPAERARRLNYGSFYSCRSGAAFIVDSIKGMIYERSPEDTVSRFEYTASIWGDTMIIKLQSLDNSFLKKDSLIVVEKVPDLILLPDNEYYIKIGGTCNHHGPRDDNYDLNCRLPDNNHYGTPNLIRVIRDIAYQYSSAHTGDRIRINDMSLQNGGKFDVYGLWRDSHTQHRIGKQVDISALAADQNNNHVSINRIEMRKYIRDATGIDPLFHDPPHFHVYTR